MSRSYAKSSLPTMRKRLDNSAFAGGLSWITERWRRSSTRQSNSCLKMLKGKRELKRKSITWRRQGLHALCGVPGQGLFVGSGVVEAELGCKILIGQRLKHSGMEWSVRGANAIISLRCTIKSNRLPKTIGRHERHNLPHFYVVGPSEYSNDSESR